MTLVLEPAHFAFPDGGLSNNYMQVASGLVGLTNPEVDFRVECERPPNPPAGNANQVWVVGHTPFAFRFESNSLVSQMVFTTGGTFGVSATYATLEAAGFPLPGEKVQLRGHWDPVTETQYLYWRASNAGVGNDGGWKLVASTARPANTLGVGTANWILGGTLGNNAMQGKVYRWWKRINGAVDFDLWAERDIDRQFEGNQDSIVPGIGPMVTVFRYPNIDRLAFDGTAGNTWTIPDAGNLDITSDICIIFGVRANIGATMTVGGKWTNTGNDRQYRADIGATGVVQFIWSTNGLDNPTVATPTPVVLNSGLIYVAAVVDADNGSAQRITRFYTSPDHPDLYNWTLHSTVGPTAGVVNIFPGTSVVSVGGHTLGANNPFNGDIEYFSIRNVIGAGGTVPAGGAVFTFDKFSSRATNEVDIQASTSQVMTKVGSALSWNGTTPRLQAYKTQFVNEIPIEPKPAKSRWSLDLCRGWRRIASVDAYEFEGILRRLESGAWRLKVPAAGLLGGEYAEPREEFPLFEDTFPDDTTTVPPDWVSMAGLWDVTAGQLRAVTMDPTTADAVIVRDIEMAADQYIEADVTAVAQGASVCVRVKNAGTFYMGRYENVLGVDRWEIYKRIGGAWTLLASLPETFPALPVRLRLEVEGSQLSFYVNGILKLQATDSSIQGEGYVGFRHWWPTGAWDNVEAGTIQPGGQYVFDPRDVDSIRIVAEGLVAYPGVLIGDDDQLQVIQDKDGEYWEWTGTDTWQYFERHLTFPQPSKEPPWTASYDNRTGVASSVIAAYINNNMGPQAIPARRWGSRLAVVDEEVGLDLSFSARLQTLRQLIIRIAKDGGIEAIPSMTFEGQLRLLLAYRRDLSDALVLSDQGDLQESKLTIEKKKASWVLSAGTGELNARVFKTASDGSIGFNRLEILSDQSSMQFDTELQADADTKLALAAQTYSVTTDLTSDQAKLALSFGLRLGDLVSVIIKGRRYRLPIEGWSFDITPQHQILRPVFGTAIPSRLAALLRRIERYNRAQNPDVIS